MHSKYLVDPAILAFFGGEVPTLQVDADNLEQNRLSVIAMMSALGGPLSPNIEVARQTISAKTSKESHITVLVYTPTTASRRLPGIRHIQGGAFIMGSAEMNEAYVRKLAEDTNSIVVSVNYRLAPETPFPGALEDCYAASSECMRVTAILESMRLVWRSPVKVAAGDLRRPWLSRFATEGRSRYGCSS